MDGDYLFDTTVVVALWRGDAAIERRVAQVAAVTVSTVTIGELIYGALLSGRVADGLAQVEDLMATNRTVEVDVETAHCFAAIKMQLRAKGKPIPENDVWIAASAQRHGLRLATRDGHFTEIDGLDLELW